MDTETIIYLVLMVGFAILSIIRKNKTQNGKLQQQADSGSESTPNNDLYKEHDTFSELFKTDNGVIPNLDDLFSTEPKKTKKATNKPKQKNVVERRPTEEIKNTHIENMQTKTPEIQIKPKFDLREAIIQSAILNRKYE